MESDDWVIRPYDSAWAAALSAGWRAAQPEHSQTARELDNRCRALLQMNGRIWTLLVNGQAAGMALAGPVPGLPSLFELDGFVAPAWQRRGWGGRLLARVKADMAAVGGASVGGTAVDQLSHAVTDMDSPAAHFLRQNGFAVEHEEWLLLKPDLTPGAPPSHPELTWGTLPRAPAIHQFCALYDRSFAPFPWYQPYTAPEAAAELAEARDLLFLRRGAVFIGFAWLRWPDEGVGQIEPMGIVAGEQGQGYGRYLLNVALHQLAQRGATQAQIGTWVENETAVALYQSVGFRHQETITYLACTV